MKPAIAKPTPKIKKDITYSAFSFISILYVIDMQINVIKEHKKGYFKSKI